MVCNKDCFHCVFEDCINDDYGPEELALVLAFEEAGGVVFQSEREALSEEIVEACMLQRKLKNDRAREATRKTRERKKSRSLGFAEGSLSLYRKVKRKDA